MPGPAAQGFICRRCGCTLRTPCRPGCWQVTLDACSRCATPAELVRFDRVGIPTPAPAVQPGAVVRPARGLQRSRPVPEKSGRYCRRKRCRQIKLRGKPFCLRCWTLLSRDTKAVLLRDYHTGKPTDHYLGLIAAAEGELKARGA